MNDDNNSDDNDATIDAIEIDEDILPGTVSDEALEAAAGKGKPSETQLIGSYCPNPTLLGACC